MTAIDSGAVTYTAADGLTVELDGAVLTVTMNRPETLNSLTEGMLDGIADAFETAATDPRVKVARLQGAGRGFCSGAGLAGDERAGRGDDATIIIDAANRAVRAITALPRPVVAVVHGPVAGVGVSLALACDLVLASDAAYFLLAFTRIGLMPDGGASALVAAAIGRTRAMRMALLAEKLPAADAVEWGLASAVYPAASFDADVDEVVGRLLAGPAVAYAKTKHSINEATLTELDAAMARERSGQSQLLRAPDLAEGITAFHERRAPKFTDV